MSSLRVGLVLGFCILLVGITASCSSQPSGSDVTYSEKDATKVSAKELFAAFGKDKKAAARLYEGKLIEVTGVVADVGTDPITEAPEVMLARSDKHAVGGVDCVFDTRYASEVAKLKEGQSVTVLGVCSGYAKKVLVLVLHCRLGADATP